MRKQLGMSHAPQTACWAIASVLIVTASLTGGGVVTVTQTQALVAVDVDTGTARGADPDVTAFAVDRG